MVGDERSPGLRGLGTTLGYEAGDRALGDVDAELEELAVDTRGAPEGIRGGHLPDQGGDLGVEGRATSGGPAGERGPVLAEAAALPAQDGVGRDDDQRPPPASLDSGQADPEQAVGRAELRAGRQSLVDDELLAQGKVLEGGVPLPVDEEGEEPEQVEYEGDHERRLWPDEADRSITC